jgi:hypothetical protein
MVQLPGARKEAVPPDTLQTFAVEELKLTGSPELAIALSASGVPTV